MREERNRVQGDVIVDEAYTLWGSISGDCRVMTNGKMYVRGAIHGDLRVEEGGRVHIFGNVGGNLYVGRKAKVINSGTVVGNATNDGGRLFVEADAKILGHVKTLGGETKIEPKFKLPDNPFEAPRRRPTGQPPGERKKP